MSGRNWKAGCRCRVGLREMFVLERSRSRVVVGMMLSRGRGGDSEKHVSVVADQVNSTVV